MELPNRNYPNGDADMLTACATLTESAIAHKAFLQTKRSNWADPYFEDLKQRLADVSAKHLGADNAKDLRNATLQILSLQKQALADLAEMKVQVNVDYADDKPKFNKGGHKGLTADGILACNKIYNEVMGNSKMATTFLRDQPGVKSTFSYARVSAAMQGGIRSKKEVTMPL